MTIAPLTFSLGNIIETLQRRAISESTFEKLQNLEVNVNVNFQQIQNELNLIKEDTQQLQLLKNKLLFIEQFYMNKTSFETEIDSKLSRIEDNMDSMKRHVDILLNEVKSIKKKLFILSEEKSTKKNPPRWKVWKIFRK